MSDRLAGKVALITGGARGIGRTLSEMFAAEGACVVMAGRNAEVGAKAENDIREAGGRATFVQTDIANRDQVARAVDTAVSEYGSLTTLVNNAVHTEGRLQGGVASCDPEGWDLVVSIDLGGVFNACHFAIPPMIDAGGGSIISIGSTTATDGLRRIPAGMATKMGVLGLMRSIALDYGGDLIRANVLTLGQVPHDQNAFVGTGEIGEIFLAASALPFHGEPSDAAYAAIYLASDESRWVTGTELVVSGWLSRVPDVLPLIIAKLAEQGEGR